MYKLNILTTNKCNAQVLSAQKNSPGVCTFCFRQEDDVEVELDTVLKVVEKISELPFENIVTVTGGEPLVSKHIVSLVKELSQKGMTVSLHTNGILLDKYIDDLTGYVTYISLPYDGNSSQIADYYRGVGYFDIQQQAMDTLRRHGIKIGLHTLLTPFNFDKIEDMAQSLIDSGYSEHIWYWFIKNFKKMNMSLNQETDVYQLDYSEYLNKVEDIRKICEDIEVYPTKNVKQRKPVFINLAGDIYIFSDVTKKNICVGNILNMPFEIIELELKKNGVEM